jgi:hypothetical protein
MKNITHSPNDAKAVEHLLVPINEIICAIADSSSCARKKGYLLLSKHKSMTPADQTSKAIYHHTTSHISNDEYQWFVWEISTALQGL